MKSTDRQPAIQVDYCFVTTGKDSDGTECPQVTVLTATDVQTGHDWARDVSSCTSKG